MAERLLQYTTRRKSSRKASACAAHTVNAVAVGNADGEAAEKKVVLVGTYKAGQLERWPGLYNYPLNADDAVDAGAAKRVDEIWLFNGARDGRYFAAEFVGTFTRDELVRDWGYPAKGAAHGEKYLLYRIQPAYAPANTPDALAAEVERVIVRAADFAKRSPKIARAIKAYLESSDRNAPGLANRLPSILLQVPRETLRVCEPGVQMEFWNALPMGLGPSAPLTSTRGDVNIEFGDSLRLCERWERPTVIVSDGPYGLASYPGDPATPEGLADFYRPFLKIWHDRALPSATLWFWNSEQGWANCHRAIEEAGWKFRNCHIWNKGMSHVAGNCNTRTIRKYPVVTEVCAQYVRKNMLPSNGAELPLKDWMREEWRRTGLPFRLANAACGVKDAATRKYFAPDHLWYFPPSEAFVRIAAYANEFGNKLGRPYFMKSNGKPFSADEWDLMRAKFHCEVGVSNVWELPAVRGAERIKEGGSCLHMNQKPLQLLMRIIRSSSDPGDVVWEPFGGLCSTAVAAFRTGRKAFAAEVNPRFFNVAKERLSHET